MKFERTFNSFRYIISGSANRIVSLLLPFFLRTLFIHYLGEEYLGVNSLFTSILGVLNLAELGIGSAISVSMYRPIAEDDKPKVRALMQFYKKVYRLIGTIIFIIGMALLPFLHQLISGEPPKGINIYFLYLIYLASTAGGYFLFAYKQVLLSAHQRSDIIENISIIIKIITCALQALTIVLLKNVYLYVILNIINGIIHNLLCAYIAHKKYPEYYCDGDIDTTTLRDIGKKISGLMIQKIGYTLSGQLDNVIISSFLGLVTVARYSNYMFIANSIGSFIQLFFGSMTAGLGNSMITNTVDWNYKNLKKIQFIGAWIVGWCSICLLCLYQSFMKVWVGNDRMLPMSTVMLIVIYFYIAYNKRLVVTFKDAAGMWWEDKWKPLVAGLLNLLINILLVSVIGVNGVIIATILTFSLVQIPWETLVLFKNYFKKSTKEYYFLHFKYIIFTLFGGTITYYVCNMIVFDNIGEFILRAIICCVIPNIIYWLGYRNMTQFADSKQVALQLFKRIMHR